MDQMSSGMSCMCPHHKVVPVAVVLIGLTFILGATQIITPYAVSLIWPTLLVIIGLTKMCSGSCKCCTK